MIYMVSPGSAITLIIAAAGASLRAFRDHPTGRPACGGRGELISSPAADSAVALLAMTDTDAVGIINHCAANVARSWSALRFL